MTLQFGQKVYKEALQLQDEGKDGNQIAKILAEQDPAGQNYGIGIVLDGNGKPVPTSPTLLDYVGQELEVSGFGKYMTSGTILEQVKIAALKWQRVPEKYWGQFKLALPSDAGTGAVKTAVEMGLMLTPQADTLGLEALGWSAHKAIARAARARIQEFDTDGVMTGAHVLPLYQAGPMNTTGLVQNLETIEARAKSAAGTNTFLVLDRAYSGFEFARELGASSYDDVMQMSYELQIKPFIEQGVTFALAISPTKAFIMFALRPCGLLLVYNPDGSRDKEITNALNVVIRARGSAFEHAISRAFVKALINDRERLEQEHEAALLRLAEAEAMWRKLVQGTPIEYLYAENYAGLFRNPKARDEAAVHLYAKHIYPVFAGGRCRQNITGIPTDDQLAKTHVAAFAEQCY